MSENFEPVQPEKRLLHKWKQDLLLNPDQGTQKKLREKLDAYRSRLSNKNADFVKDAQYKIDVLSRLLEPGRGSVDPNKLAVELSDLYPDFDPALFENAMRVIWELNAVQSEEPKKQEVGKPFELNKTEIVQERLKAKRREYVQRFGDPDSELKYQNVDAYYKWTVIDQLIEHGVVDPYEIHEQVLSENSQKFDEKKFWNAVAVVETYNRGTTIGLKGSKGF